MYKSCYFFQRFEIFLNKKLKNMRNEYAHTSSASAYVCLHLYYMKQRKDKLHNFNKIKCYLIQGRREQSEGTEIKARLL